jgi:xylulokinase
MYLGIDLGTSEVKIALVDGSLRLVDVEGGKLTSERPKPNWSEQDPRQWFVAASEAIKKLRARHGDKWPAIRAIGLSGQMHGAVLLDDAHQPLRPAILWNDGRSEQECLELVQSVPDFYARSANLAMPGFTAPKLLWVRKHEPDIFARIRRVLLPKDYFRFVLTGEFASDPSDASGTLWFNPEKRQWDDVLLAATELNREAMPTICDGSAVSGVVRADLARAWGLSANVIVAGGAGDNAASAVGVGAVRVGQGFVSLGTSGVAFVVTDQLRADPERAIHAFCHTLPGLWHQMTVMLSAASCLAWWKNMSGRDNESSLLSELENAWEPASTTPLFLPYLSGERTPHNDPNIRGAFLALDAGHATRDLTYAVVEGVAFGMADGFESMRQAGTQVGRLALVGGGARSAYWAQLMADALNVELFIPSQGIHAGALGAARLAALASGATMASVLSSVQNEESLFVPNANRQAFLNVRFDRFRAFYPRLKHVPC